MQEVLQIGRHPVESSNPHPGPPQADREALVSLARRGWLHYWEASPPLLCVVGNVEAPQLCGKAILHASKEELEFSVGVEGGAFLVL